MGQFLIANTKLTMRPTITPPPPTLDPTLTAYNPTLPIFWRMDFVSCKLIKGVTHLVVLCGYGILGHCRSCLHQSAVYGSKYRKVFKLLCYICRHTGNGNSVLTNTVFIMVPLSISRMSISETTPIFQHNYPSTLRVPLS